MGRLRYLLMVCAACALGWAPAQARDTADGPSFDCDKASSGFEKAICADPDLSAADRLMARLYSKAKGGILGNGHSNQRAIQREWLRVRETQCNGSRGVEAMTSCRLAVMNIRNEELATAILMDDPELALSTLKRTVPNAAATLEAIYIFAEQPRDTDWSQPHLAEKRERIEWLISPWVKTVFHDDRAVYGKAILEDFGIRSFADAISSVENCARFLNVASAFGDDEFVGLVMPCAAIVRHPALLGASSPVFGSTLDNFTMDTDCWQTLPATPALGNLAGAISERWPYCDGTIRFATFSGFGESVDRARLGFGLDGEQMLNASDLQSREDIPPALILAAVRELESHYVENGLVSAADGSRIAKDHVRNLLSYEDMGC